MGARLLWQVTVVGWGEQDRLTAGEKGLFEDFKEAKNFP